MFSRLKDLTFFDMLTWACGFFILNGLFDGLSGRSLVNHAQDFGKLGGEKINRFFNRG